MLAFTGFVIALLATIVVARQFKRYPLTTTRTPFGIISFELAATSARAEAMIAAWRDAGLLQNARPNIATIDTRFIPCYTAALALGCLWGAEVMPQVVPIPGVMLAVVSVTAGILDFAENAALLRTLDAAEAGRELRIWPALAFACALPKLVIVVCSSLYILAALALTLLAVLGIR